MRVKIHGYLSHAREDRALIEKLIRYLSNGSDAKTAENAEDVKFYGPTNKPTNYSFDGHSGL